MRTEFLTEKVTRDSTKTNLYNSFTECVSHQFNYIHL